MGYHRVGFEVVGVDINPQPHFPFEFHQADALKYPLDGFDVIHASPPCQRFSCAMSLPGCNKNAHPDLIEPTRKRLQLSKTKYVIENVVGAPLINPIMLCGSSFGLDLRRHRLFELGGFFILSPECNHGWQKPRFPVGVGIKRKGQLSSVVHVFGHSRFKGDTALRKRAMKIDWMNNNELTQAIPLAYTEYISKQLMHILNHRPQFEFNNHPNRII